MRSEDEILADVSLSEEVKLTLLRQRHDRLMADRESRADKRAAPERAQAARRAWVLGVVTALAGALGVAVGAGGDWLVARQEGSSAITLEDVQAENARALEALRAERSAAMERLTADLTAAEAARAAALAEAEADSALGRDIALREREFQLRVLEQSLAPDDPVVRSERLLFYLDVGILEGLNRAALLRYVPPEVVDTEVRTPPQSSANAPGCLDGRVYQQLVDAEPDPPTVALDGAEADIVVTVERPPTGPQLAVPGAADFAARPTVRAYAALTDNYAVDADTPEERTRGEYFEETQFIEAVLDTPVWAALSAAAQACPSFGESRLGQEVFLRNLLFEPFTAGGRPGKTGFEHVFLGEVDGSRALGQHFWWRIWQEMEAGRIGSFGWRDVAEGDPNATWRYIWTPDPGGRQAEKPLGSAWLGATPELLVALLSARTLGAPAIASVDGQRYDFKHFMSDNRQHLRTFYVISQRPD